RTVIKIAVLDDKTLRVVQGKTEIPSRLLTRPAVATTKQEGESHYALDLNQHLTHGEARVELPFTLRPSEPCTVEMYVTPRSTDSLDYCSLFIAGNGVQLRQQAYNWDWLVTRKHGTYAQVHVPRAIEPGRRT